MKSSSYNEEEIPQRSQAKPSKPIKLHLKHKHFDNNLKEPPSPTDQEIIDLRDSLFKTHNFENISMVKLLKLHNHLQYHSKSFMQQQQYINARKFIYLQEEVEAEILQQSVKSKYVIEGENIKPRFKKKCRKSSQSEQDVNSILFKFDLETDKKLEEMDSRASFMINQFETNWKGQKQDDLSIRLNTGKISGNYQRSKFHLMYSLYTERKLYKEGRQRKRDEIDRKSVV